MNPGTFTRKSAMPIILAMSLLLLAPFTITSAEVTELNVTPEVVVQGGTLSISGKASPNEDVWIGSSFEIALPVSDGKYSCDFTDVYFPAGEKTFSVTAENVKNIRVSLYPVFWQTIEYPLKGPLNATEGIATLSVSFPATMHGAKIDISGKKNVKVYGDAADAATSVNLKSVMSIKVTADSKGDFELNINTGGAPKGEFLITAGGIEKPVEVVSAEAVPVPTPSSSPTSSLFPSPSPVSQNETNQSQPPQKTTKPFCIPGFEAIGCIIALVILVMRKIFNEN